MLIPSILKKINVKPRKKENTWLQRIQVEHLMASVVAFVVTVELFALRGKMTDVARQE